VPIRSEVKVESPFTIRRISAVRSHHCHILSRQVQVMAEIEVDLIALVTQPLGSRVSHRNDGRLVTARTAALRGRAVRSNSAATSASSAAERAGGGAAPARVPAVSRSRLKLRRSSAGHGVVEAFDGRHGYRSPGTNGIAHRLHAQDARCLLHETGTTCFAKLSVVHPLRSTASVPRRT